MRAVKRLLMAFGLGLLVAGLARLRGRGGAPPGGPGWQELDVTETRS